MIRTQMSMSYEQIKQELVNQISAQKCIYKFRTFIYSLNKDVRHSVFAISRTFLENELHKNTTITATEHERLQHLINHWQWGTFDTNAVIWWTGLSSYSKSLTLMTLLHLWIDDITVFDSESFETSTDGIR
jgi:hypothetical protein